MEQVDGSLAHLFGYHHLCLASTSLFGTTKQRNYYYQETGKEPLFWGNAFNPLDQNLLIERKEPHYVLNGHKTFCSGARDSDRLLISAFCKDKKKPVYLVIPTSRDGVLIHDDWDNIGQRQTDSGSVTFQQVNVCQEEILHFHEQDSSPFSSIRPLIAQTLLTHVLLGIAEGAFEQAKEYTKTITRPWITSHVNHAFEDPYILHHYGNLAIKLKAASALSEKTALAVHHAWEKERNLTFEQRGQYSVDIAIAKSYVTEASLEITSSIFKGMGARSTATKHGFDRFWRNVRTHTLHDPIDYKIRDIGHWALNNQFPELTPYS
jgi:alkylation response protein AidB-like acyl-CoA dehydrogenase